MLLNQFAPFVYQYEQVTDWHNILPSSPVKLIYAFAAPQPSADNTNTTPYCAMKRGEQKDGGTENKHSVCNSVFATQLGNTVNSSVGVW
jgi:hypothetical protein